MTQHNWFERWWVNTWPHRWHVRVHVPRFLRKSPDPIRGEVLEVGAGSGWTSRRILETFPQVELTATDINPEFAERYERLKRVYGNRLQVQEADMLHLPFDRDSFDIVLLINVIHHISRPDLPKAVQELIRVTRDGGLIGMSEYTSHVGKNTPSRKEIEQALIAEQCSLEYVRAGRGYDIWARVPYPVGENQA